MKLFQGTDIARSGGSGLLRDAQFQRLFLLKCTIPSALEFTRNEPVLGVDCLVLARSRRRQRAPRKRLWSEERVSFESTYYRTHRATIYDRPDSAPPIYVAAAGPLMARYAGQSAEGFICTSGKQFDLYTQTLLPNLNAGLALAGRPSHAIDRMIEMKVSYDHDLTRAMQDTRHWAALSLPQEQKVSTEDPIEMEKLADALPAEQAAKRWIVSSDPDEHIERIRRYVELGFRHLVFHAPGLDQARFLQLYSREIIPRLRRQFD